MSDTASSLVNRWLFPGWVIFAVVNTAAMFALPGQETIPFHFVYISIALVYGFQPWPLRKTYAILGLVAVTTGAALAWHVKNNVIGWEETAEIPLMAVLFLVMVWHVRRRVAATREARRYADSEHKMREMQKRFVRFASHELRTPVTVGRGFAELIRDAQPDSQAAQDAIVVLEELDNLERIAARLLTLAWMDERSAMKPSVVSLSAQLERTVTRWRAAANRDWRLSPTSAVVVADRQRLETALDSLVENAVRYLLDEGADVNVRENGNSTPLIEATFGGHIEVIKELLLRGADINVNCEQGTALDIALFRKNKAAADLLRHHGGRIFGEIRAGR